MEKLRPEILRNHGKDMAFEAVGQAMVANGTDAFSSADGFVMDILDLQKDVELEDDEIEEKKPAAQDAQDSGDQASEPKVWVERDRVVSSTIRTTNQQHEVFVTKGISVLEKTQQAKSEILADVEDAFRVNFAGEIKMLDIRLEAMDLCFKSKDEEKLKQYIARFSGLSSAKEAATEKVEIGQCPPCAAYAKLRPVVLLDSLVEKYHHCTQPNHMKAQLHLPWASLLAFKYIFFVRFCAVQCTLLRYYFLATCMLHVYARPSSHHFL